MEPFSNERVAMYRPRRCVCVAAALPVRHRRGDAHGVGTIRCGTNPAARRAKQLLAEAQSDLSEQAAQQQQKVAGGLESRCLCSVVWVSTGAQPDQVGVDVVMLDLRSDRNDGQGVTQELLEVRVIGEQQGVRVGG